MKKTQLIIFFFLLAVFASYSQQRSEADAMKIADSFLKKSALNLRAGSSAQSSVSLSYKCTDNASLRSTNSNVYYYVFNVNTDKGFVIVSGDERAKDVLGYSENGGFDIENISPNFRYWLSCYQEELEMLAKQPLDAVPTFAEVINIQTDAATKEFSNSVSPLLGGIKWDQGEPYSNLCPTDKTTGKRSVVGCVATGMAQVMMYYKWPVTGTGFYTYQSDNVNGDITANFGATTYDWANMLDAYTESASETQKNAVATLMHHCGVAVNMTYTSGESGANSYSIPNALATYFGYDPNMKVYTRESYTKAQWSDLIKEELSASRPVLYSGRSSGGGHLFVCDGYDSNNKFHFNWGWSGSSDGYYEITALNPSALGIGGGTGGGFNSSQGIFTGIQKSTGAPDTSSYEIVHKGALTVSETEIARAGTFTLSIGSCGNFGTKAFTGSLGFILTTETGEPVALLGAFNATIISAGETYGAGNITGRSIDTSVANGNYRIYYGYWEYGTASDNWKIAQTRSAAPVYVNVTVASDKITFSSPTEGLPVLTVNSIEVLNTLYENGTAQFKVSVTNTGGEYLDSYIGIYMENQLNEDMSDFVAVDKYFIGTNETKDLILTGTIPAEFVVSSNEGDDYFVVLMYDPTNSGAGSLNSKGAIIGKLKKAPVVNNVSMELASALSFLDNNNVTPNTFNLKVHLKNTGDYFDGDVIVYYNTGGTSYQGYDYQTVIMEPNEEKIIYFTQAPPVDFGTQKVATRFSHTLGANWLLYQESPILQYTFKDDVTGIEEEQFKSVGNVNVYPNPVTDFVSFKSDEVVKSVRVISLTGQVVVNAVPMASGVITIPVSNISAGTYIIQVETDADIRTSKFVKK